MLKVINLYGGAGCGKSTMAAQIFAHLKVNNYSVELVQEYQKSLVYEEASPKLWNNQVLIFAQQYHQLYRLIGKVDYAITDNPLLTSLVYRKYTNSPVSLDSLVSDCYKQFTNYNYVLHRYNSYYTREGRIHSLEQSIQIDKEIQAVLDQLGLMYKVACSYEDVIEDLRL